MVSENFRELEAKIAEVLVTHEEFVKEIAYKLGKDESTVNKALYTSSVATASRPTEIALVLNEFLIALNEKPEVSK